MRMENISECKEENVDDKYGKTENVFRKVSKEESEEEILMLYTTMDGCSPCKNLSNAIDELEDEYDQVIFFECDTNESPTIKDFLMERGLFAHPSIVITNGKLIFWKMGAGPVEKEKKFYSELFDAMLESEIKMNREEEEVEVMTEELGKLSFEGQVIE